MTSPRAAAKEIIGMLQYLFQGPDEVAPAFESDFPHIDFSKYRDLEITLSTENFRKISDVELLNISNDPTSIYNKTLIRSFLSHDGSLVISCYELRPKWSRLAILLARGMLALRWIDAPLFFISMIPARFILDIETQLCNDTFIVTSNAAAAGLLEGPPTIDELHLPYDTALEGIKAAHLARVTKNTEDHIKVHPILSEKELFEMQKRLKLERSAHRSSCDWITKDEIERMCQGNKEITEITYKELRKLIDEHK
jgi:hypothetical protein